MGRKERGQGLEGLDWGILALVLLFDCALEVERTPDWSFPAASYCGTKFCPLQMLLSLSSCISLVFTAELITGLLQTDAAAADRQRPKKE